jgi:PPOX class probable F420-dependent enzyme
MPPAGSAGDLLRLADESFVALTTFRRTGAPVSTAVWIVADPGEGELLVMTPAESGKVKRLRNDPRVTLQPCDRFGRVREGSPVVAATATLGPYEPEAEQVFRDVYGLEYRAVMGLERVAGGRKDRVALHLHAV